MSNNALRYAILARDSYTLPPDIGQQDSASRAIVTVTDDVLTVAISGTNNIACFLADLDVELQSVAGMGQVHRGFYQAYSDISGDLMRLSPSVVTGHSLGASMSLLYAAELCLAGKPPNAVYAFEPPRVSIDSTIGDLLRKHGVKLVLTRFGNDIVTEIPRLIHNWTQPDELNRFGDAREPLWNVHDHSIDNVVAYYSK